MLHQDVLMADIDVDQWRNAQSLILRSAKGARRLVVIHEEGRVLKFRHTSGAAVGGRVERVDDPHRLAAELYATNRDLVDFVVVMERGAVDAYFARIQDAWDIDEDLDVFVQRTYRTLDDFPDGIVTHPGPARDTLGLQWRTGASRDDLQAALLALVAPGTTAVLGVHDAGALWTSLVLDVDDDGRITSVTTADPSLVDVTGPLADVAERLCSWVASRGRHVSAALVLDRPGADELLRVPMTDKAGVALRLAEEGRAVLRSTVPAS